MKRDIKQDRNLWDSVTIPSSELEDTFLSRGDGGGWVRWHYNSESVTLTEPEIVESLAYALEELSSAQRRVAALRKFQAALVQSRS